MTKLVCLSDTHMRHRKIPMPDGDILIHAGDSTSVGDVDELDEVGSWLYSLKDKYKHRILIAGNHELGLQSNPNLIKRCFDSDLIYLQDSSVTLEGINFYGSPFTPDFYNWAFMESESALAKRWLQITTDTDVLITHGPPESILDKNASGECCGSRSLYEAVKQLKNLKHHIFGHIHHDYGQLTIGDVSFHNVASLDDYYQYKNKPQVIEI